MRRIRIEPIDVLPITFLAIAFFIWGAGMFLAFA